jgi:hypothetical protein
MANGTPSAAGSVAPWRTNVLRTIAPTLRIKVRLGDLDAVFQPVNTVQGKKQRLQALGRPGAIWRSGDLPFSLSSPAGTFLTVTASEAYRRGYQAALWGERQGGVQRILMAGFRIQDETPQLSGAREIARVPVGIVPTLSMEPPGLPFPGRWMAWTDSGRAPAATRS